MSEIITLKSKFMRNIFDHNTYVLGNGQEAVIIDAGADLSDVLKAVNGRKVLAILLTHLHFDHTWFLEEYLNEFKDAYVYICENQENRFLDKDLNGSCMIKIPKFVNVEGNRIKYYSNELKLGSFDFKVFFTPGHTLDGVCLLCEDNLFTGDTVFADGIGRTDLKDSSNLDMMKSLKQIAEIDFKKAYPGHYNSATKQKILDLINFYLS